MENSGATYCKFCDKECNNGANWSSHVSSAKHLKKTGVAKPATVTVVANEDDYDDWEDFEGNFDGPKAPVTSTILPSPSIWDQPTTSRGLVTPRPFIVNAAPNITSTAVEVTKLQQPATSMKATTTQHKPITIICNKPTTVVAKVATLSTKASSNASSNTNGKPVKQLMFPLITSSSTSQVPSSSSNIPTTKPRQVNGWNGMSASSLLTSNNMVPQQLNINNKSDFPSLPAKQPAILPFKVVTHKRKYSPSKAVSKVGDFSKVPNETPAPVAIASASTALKRLLLVIVVLVLIS